MQSNFKDVGDFHKKFGLPTADDTAPGALPEDVLRFRGNFLLEELAEFFSACNMGEIADQLEALADYVKTNAPIGNNKVDLAAAGDALVDLNYVSLGTAHLMGLPFDEMWREVQRANMSKVRASGSDDPRSKRSHSLDVVKPVDFVPPNHEPILELAKRHNNGEWIEYNGAGPECPIHPERLIYYRTHYRGGDLGPVAAGRLLWTNLKRLNEVTAYKFA